MNKFNKVNPTGNEVLLFLYNYIGHQLDVIKANDDNAYMLSRAEEWIAKSLDKEPK
jgi:hypothetical protein